MRPGSITIAADEEELPMLTGDFGKDCARGYVEDFAEALLYHPLIIIYMCPV